MFLGLNFVIHINWSLNPIFYFYQISRFDLQGDKHEEDDGVIYIRLSFHL